MFLAPQSSAELRDLAMSVSPDPFPDNGGAPNGWGWIYAEGQYELAVLHRLVTEGYAANRHVDYAANFGSLYSSVEFQRELSGSPTELSILATGSLHITLDGHVLPVRTDSVGGAVFSVPRGGRRLSIRVTSVSGPAAFALRGADREAFARDWEVLSAGGAVAEAQLRWGSGRPPHEAGEPIRTIAAAAVGPGLYDFGSPMLARVVVKSNIRPELGSGESVEEALAAPAVAETRHHVVARADGSWVSEHQLGLRYLRVSGVEPESVTAEASVRPVARRGAFGCSDEVLTRIWSTSAYTLRSCMQGLMVDGIKRDRMPWMGDQALSTMGNAYTFADGDIVRDGLTALGRPREGYINGISDYSLWWLINHALYQRYFGDPGYLQRQAEHINSFVEKLAEYATSDGVFRPPTDPQGFAPTPGSVFIDWGVSVSPGKDYTALQMLWFWALSSTGELLTAAKHINASRWSELAERVQQNLQATAWDADAAAWREYLEPSNPGSSYPNFLAVLSGVVPPKNPTGVGTALLTGKVGTPFMTAFALRALAASGEQDVAVGRIRKLWGGMLDAGAQTFWEESDREAESPYAMYGRPFGKSLCHAWAAGPAMLLPETVLGLRPIGHGWSQFEVDPHLGGLTWAGTVVPVPGGGEISVHARPDKVTVKIPLGTTLVRNQEAFPGPNQVTW